MPDHDDFIRHLQRALHHLYEPDRLRTNPLAALFGVANRLDTFVALQRILTEAIAALEPKDEAPAQPGAWEIYEPLFLRYMEQLDQQQVARQLGMSVRHFRRKEHAALLVLAGRLWEQFGLEARAHSTAGQDPPSQAAPDGSGLQDLAWLHDAQPEKPVSLAEALPEVMALAQPLASRRQVRLHLSLVDGLPSLAVHPLALSQCLVSLLSVAIPRATDGAVSISAQALPPEVAIAVRCLRAPADPSPLAESDLASLHLARQLAELCRGTLSVDDRVFAATLRIPAVERLPVLAIDDNADTLQLLQRYTSDTNYRLIVTQDPEQALALVERYSPRAIVLDVMMPRVDGWRVLAQLRQHPLTARIPVIVCTIMAQEEMALALGASGFLHKPVTRQAFLSTLDQQMESRGRESR